MSYPTTKRYNVPVYPSGSRLHYTIAGGLDGRNRLKLLHRIFKKSTDRLLDAAGVSEGARVLDSGCGGGDVAVDLARRVGKTGHVVGTDLDDVQMEIAKKEAEELGLGDNIEYKLLDAMDPYPLKDDEPKFDVAYIRFLLSHLPRPEAAVNEIFKVLADDGVIIVEDTDFDGHFAFPESEALKSLQEWEIEIRAKRGGNGNIGRELPLLLKAAGFVDVVVDVITPADIAPNSDTKLLTAVTLTLIKAAIVEDELATSNQVDHVIRELYAQAADPNQLLSIPRVVRVIARKP